MNFIEDFHVKYTCAVNQIAARGYILSTALAQGATSNGKKYYHITPRAKAVCPTSIIMENRRVELGFNDDLTKLFSDGLGKTTTDTFLNPLYYGLSGDVYYKEDAYAGRDIPKFAFNLGRLYAMKYKGYNNMSINLDILRKYNVLAQ